MNHAFLLTVLHDCVRLRLMDGAPGATPEAIVDLPRDDAALGATLRAALDAIPRRRLRRPSVVAAVAAPHAIAKSLEGYGATADASALTTAVRANPARFFIAPPDEVVCAPVRSHDDGWIAWAIRKAVLEAIVGAADASGVRLRGICLSDATHGGDVDRRLRWHWDPRAEERARSHARVRRGAMAASIVLALSVGTFAPWLRPLARSIPPAPAEADRGRALGAESDLRAHVESLAAIDTLAAFAVSGRSVVDLLATLSARLPAPSAIVSLRFDRQGVTFVALTPVGTAVLPALAELEGVSSTQLVGAVTRESIDGQEVQRVAATMSLARAAR
jgi:hypothetical protein